MWCPRARARALSLYWFLGFCVGENMFDRVIDLIGKEKFKLLQSKKVLIIGCGGVGGYALETLVRSGINNIGIIDFDIIDISNLNIIL